MSRFVDVALPRVNGLELSLRAPNELVMRGTITIRDPAGELAEFIRTLHSEALAEGLAEVRVDIIGLKFVNSSAIRLFVDWATTVKALKTPCYKLCFVTDRRVTWQKTSFSALVSMVGDVLRVEESA
jgi:hypothetical protein